MANAILNALGSRTSFTITLASLASSTTGVGRQATLVDNTTTKAAAALVYLKITTGTTPTINKNVYVYLLRYDNSAIGDDSVGASDAAWTRVNAQLLGTIFVNSASSNIAYYGVFDTAFLGVLGPKWAIGIVHDTAVNLNSTEGNHLYAYIPYNPEVQ
jgi:hypothetical protein